MARLVHEYRCLIISPSDVETERGIAVEVLNQWNASNGRSSQMRLEPVLWETHSHPEMGKSPQGALNDQIVHDADLGVAIFWSRLGSATASYASGSLEEIEQLIKDRRPVMLYRSTQAIPQDRLKDDQYKKLDAAFEDFKSRGLYRGFSSSDDFRRHLTNDLPLLLGGLPKSAFDGLAPEVGAVERKQEEKRLEERTIRLWGSLLGEMRTNFERVRFMIDEGQRGQFGFGTFDFTLSEKLIGEFVSLVPQSVVAEVNRLNSALRQIDGFQRQANYPKGLAFAKDAASKNLYGRFNALLQGADDFGAARFERWDLEKSNALPKPIDPSATIEHSML